MKPNLIQFIRIREKDFKDKQLIKDIYAIKKIDKWTCFDNVKCSVPGSSYTPLSDYKQGMQFASKYGEYYVKQKLINGKVDDFKIFFYIALIDWLYQYETAYRDTIKRSA